MSDMRPNGPPGPPPSPPSAGGAQIGPEGIAAMKNVENNRSQFNPTDVAAFIQQGQLRQDMTVGEYMENIFGVKWEDPIVKLIHSAKKQLDNRTGVGKAQNIAKDAQRPMPNGRPGMPGGMPGNRPSAQGRPNGQGMGLSDIIDQM